MAPNEKIYITLSKTDVVNAYMWQHDEENYENGVRELHIFPSMIRNSGKGSSDNPYAEKIEYIQAGNSYGPNFDYSKISVFGLDDLVDDEIISKDASNIGEYSFERDEARKDWFGENAKRLGIDVDDEEQYEAAKEDYADEIQEKIDEYIENAVVYERSVVAGALKSEISDEEMGQIYAIIWED